MLFVETDLRKRMPIPLWPFLVFGAAVGSASRLDAVVVYVNERYYFILQKNMHTSLLNSE